MAPRKTPVLPHNLEAERALLGGVLVNNARFADAAAVLKPSDFFRNAHRQVFEAMLSLQARGVALDLVLLTEELTRTGLIDEVGGPAYVASLVDGTPESTNVRHYAEVVLEKAHLRALISAGLKVAEMAYEGDQPAAKIADAASAALAACVPVGDGAVLVGKEMADYYGRVASGTLPQPVPTGFAALDPLLRGGFRPGDLVILAARPSVGKTGWATKVADHVSRTLEMPTLFFSLEMSAEQIAARMLSLRAHVPSARVEAGDFTEAEANRLAHALQQEAPLYVVVSAETPTQIGAWCQTIRRQHGLALVVVDYLQLLTANRRRDSDEAEIASVSKALKRVAQSEKVVMLVLSQLSRAPEGRKDKRPHLSDLRGSGALEQDADVAVLLYRGEMHGVEGSEGIAEAIVAKHRNGPVGVRRLAFVKELAMFGDLAEEDDGGNQ